MIFISAPLLDINLPINPTIASDDSKALVYLKSTPLAGTRVNTHSRTHTMFSLKSRRKTGETVQGTITSHKDPHKKREVERWRVST